MSRLGKLRSRLGETGFGAVLISQPENRRYLSGFTGSAGYLLITQDRAILATDFRYTQQAQREAPLFEVMQVRGEPPQWLPALLSELKPERLGIEANFLTYTLYEAILTSLNGLDPRPQLLPTPGLVEESRMVKEAGEIELLSRAAALADAAVAHARSVAHPGMTERELAWEIEKYLKEGGSGSLPFELIVASGPNAALPHAHPTERPLAPGEAIVIDIGARIGGYCSDLTRTICLGAPDDMFQRIYGLVLEAQRAAIAGIRPGMTGEEADALARQVIEGAGYGDSFGHGLGHGVGLATHEEPRLGSGSRQVLTRDMVFTVEPGVYLPEWGGVRIEDMVLLEDRPRLLTGAEK